MAHDARSMSAEAGSSDATRIGETSLAGDVGGGKSFEEEAGLRFGQVQADLAAESFDSQQDRPAVASGLQQAHAALFSCFGPVQPEQHCAAGGDRKRQNASNIRSAGISLSYHTKTDFATPDSITKAILRLHSRLRGTIRRFRAIGYFTRATMVRAFWSVMSNSKP